MPAYAYPIKIDHSYRPVRYVESRVIEHERLTLADLAFVGDDEFEVEPIEYGGFEVQVYRSRFETEEEHSARVEREHAYMTEYRRRNV